ncbi:methane monooxygenase/ammonia monooxygenase subunit C [Candidatus Nitrosoglobus terrae]|uniref:Methane monooxygenase/ammonia monooxygenase subunit C n=1 Tax=Candidatus Nitrosoglobus terrae TaxID=1630141 RepID=A0A1Q2SP38_9GAMM|nr:methane monooxygenase/ammonia monooxygenase subunit C [Candidatus Nitrosoglobus terrae]BAW80892.1 methane monooxygenase/ammonia monooxygenase subunit C [Candidatus Nitrosoglobus terrae]
MAATSRAIARGHAQVVDEPLFAWSGMWLAAAGFFVFYIGVRWYEGVYGWKYGLDSFAPEFETYWMNLLYAELVIEFGSLAALLTYLWKTRDRDIDRVAPREELRRYCTLYMWWVIYGIGLFWGASFFTEQDGAWHQTVIRDTDFTPSHIIEFYMSYPIYVMVGLGSFAYAKTRIPYFAKSWSVSYLMLTMGPFMIFPNVGLNEWGHTFWFMEELFVAPLHWGFVFFAWFILAMFGVFMQVQPRIRELIGREFQQSADYAR